MVRWFEILVEASHVATCTITAMRRNADMIPTRRKPYKGSMTVIAGIGRF
jgi:hypothetical protein